MKSNLNVALKKPIAGSKVMKIWLPDSLYRLKPLLSGFAGATLLYVSDHLFTTILAVLVLGYGCWIIVIRLLWSGAEPIKIPVIKIRAVSAGTSEKITYYARFSDD
jgi:hypothetical protein